MPVFEFSCNLGQFAAHVLKKKFNIVKVKLSELLISCEFFEFTCNLGQFGTRIVKKKFNIADEKLSELLISCEFLNLHAIWDSLEYVS